MSGQWELVGKRRDKGSKPSVVVAKDNKKKSNSAIGSKPPKVEEVCKYALESKNFSIDDSLVFSASVSDKKPL